MVNIVLGGFLGAEGKGKVIEFLAKNGDIVVKSSGGANPGHKIKLNEKTYIFKLIPTEILSPEITVVLGNGVIIDPKTLVNEIKILEENGVSIQNLKISEKAHILLPYHIELDNLLDEVMDNGNSRLGGVASAYCDKCERTGIRVGHFVSSKFGKILKKNLDVKNKILEAFEKEKIDGESLLQEYSAYAEKIAPYVCDTVAYLQESAKANKTIICESAGAALLDVDFGNYPYVSAGNSSIGGVLEGTGLNYKQINEVYGVVKAYASREGEGPFLTEEEDEEIVDKIREFGMEYESITKNPRRCGWLDLTALKYAVQINGITALAINHLDVIGKLKKIKLCVAYRYDGKVTTKYSSNPTYLAKCQPVYEEFDGKFGDLLEADAREDLCEEAQNFLNRIEEVVGIPIKFIGIGTNNENILFK